MPLADRQIVGNGMCVGRCADHHDAFVGVLFRQNDDDVPADKPCRNTVGDSSAVCSVPVNDILVCSFLAGIIGKTHPDSLVVIGFRHRNAGEIGFYEHKQYQHQLDSIDADIYDFDMSYGHGCILRSFEKIQRIP